MILTLARCSYISNLMPSLLQTIARSLRQIIVILFVNLNQAIPQGIWHRVTITYDNHILVAIIMLYQTGNGTIASHDMPGVLQ